MAPKLTPSTTTRARFDEYKSGVLAVALSIPEGSEVDEPVMIAKWLESYGQVQVHFIG